MARWNFGFNSDDSAMKTQVDIRDGEELEWVIEQTNDKDIIDEVKLDRELIATQKKVGHWRKAFTIPDIVAIEILMKYGLDVHDPDFFRDNQKVKKLKYLIKTEYPHLLIST